MTDATLGQLSNNLMGSAVVVYALAALVYTVQLAVARRATDDVHVPVLVPAGVGAVGAVDAVGSVPAVDVVDVGAGSGTRAGGLSGSAGPEPGSSDEQQAARDRQLDGVGYALTALAFLLHLTASTTRGLSADRVPWGNMYEFATTGALAATAAFLVTQRVTRVRGLGVVVVGTVLLTLGLGVTVLYTPAGPLVPALNSYWLVIHVAAAILSAGVFTVGAAVTVLYLLRRRSDRLGKPSRLPSTDRLDRVAQVAHTFAFPVWTFAVVAGAIWAENAWGRYWGWDPKETWAFITWVVYAAYLHARATAGWRGRAAAWLALLGYVALLFNFFGVNMWITGLHSYAGV